MAKTATATPKLTVGSRIDALYDLKQKKREASAVVDEIEEQIKLAELALIEVLDKEGMDKATGKKATVSISEAVVPQVDGPAGWDAFYAYIKKTGYFHLLERRPSVTGCRELFETKGKIPGVMPFLKRGLNVRVVPN